MQKYFKNVKERKIKHEKITYETSTIVDLTGRGTIKIVRETENRKIEFTLSILNDNIIIWFVNLFNY
jgi:hypothetical protein